MTQYFRIHPDNPQARLIRQAVDIIQKGGVVVYPTDSSYAIGCHVGDKPASDKIRKIRQLSDKHQFTLMCRDLSDLSQYAVVDNHSFRLIKQHIPAPVTFVLKATAEVPKRLQCAKRKTIGLRVPKNNICQMLLEELGEPMLTSTLIFPDHDQPMTDAEEIRDFMSNKLPVDLILDGDACGREPTTVVDLSHPTPEVLRQGLVEVDL